MVKQVGCAFNILNHNLKQYFVYFLAFSFRNIEIVLLSISQVIFYFICTLHITFTFLFIETEHCTTIFILPIAASFFENANFFKKLFCEHLFRKISYQDVMQQHIKIVLISILSINFLMCKSFKDYLNSVSLASLLLILKMSFHKIYKVSQIILLVFTFDFILDCFHF